MLSRQTRLRPSAGSSRIKDTGQSRSTVSRSPYVGCTGGAGRFPRHNMIGVVHRAAASLSDLVRSAQCRSAARVQRQIPLAPYHQDWHVDHLRQVQRSRAPQPYGPIPIQHRCRSTGLGDLPSADGQHVGWQRHTLRRPGGAPVSALIDGPDAISIANSN